MLSDAQGSGRGRGECCLRFRKARVGGECDRIDPETFPPKTGQTSQEAKKTAHLCRRGKVNQRSGGDDSVSNQEFFGRVSIK